MAGRPPKPVSEKKQREAIYFEPHILEWLKGEAERRKTTTSAIVNLLVEESMNACKNVRIK